LVTRIALSSTGESVPCRPAHSQLLTALWSVNYKLVAQKIKMKSCNIQTYCFLWISLNISRPRNVEVLILRLYSWYRVSYSGCAIVSFVNVKHDYTASDCCVQALRDVGYCIHERDPVKIRGQKGDQASREWGFDSIIDTLTVLCDCHYVCDLTGWELSILNERLHLSLL
jgi:hypothetical protein